MNKSSGKIVDYVSPPVVEVVAGVRFERLEGLIAPYFGRFWERLPKEYVRVEQQPPLLREADHFQLADAPIRCWFLADDGRRLVQLQNDAVFYNWRRLTDDDAGSYPEFASIFPEFKARVAEFEEFCESELGRLPTYRDHELTYVNLIPVANVLEHCNSPGDLMVDHVRARAARHLGDPIGFDWTSAYRFPDNRGELTVRTSTAVRTDDNQNLIRLELTAKGESAQGTNAFDLWYESAHDYIVRSFADLTDKNVQNEIWRKR